MDCARFEQALAELMAGEVDEGARQGRIQALRSHAEGCDGCSGSLDLVELMAQPAGERDVVDDPGEAYWGDFDRRLAARIDAEETPVGRRTAPWWWAAAAALLIAAVLGAWTLSGRQGPTEMAVVDEPPTETPAEPIAEARPEPEPGDGPVPAPDPDVQQELIAEAAPPTAVPEEPVVEEPAVEDAADDAGWFAAWDYEEPSEANAEAAVMEGDLFPDTTDLDVEARRELLRWLKERTS